MTHKTRKYLSRLKEQYVQLKSNKYMQEQRFLFMSYQSVRLFCLDLELISLENIEQMEQEVNENLTKKE